jgi:hypothetical protein
MDEANYAKCSCPSCLNHVAFPTNLLGTVIDCPHCARPFKLELTTTLSHPSAGLDLPALEAALQGKVESRETTAQYKLAVALVAVVMVVMVVLYLAIVAGAAGGLIWHATRHVSLVSGPRSGGFIRWLLYLTPIVILLLLGSLPAQTAPGKARGSGLSPAARPRNRASSVRFRRQNLRSNGSPHACVCPPGLHCERQRGVRARCIWRPQT